MLSCGPGTLRTSVVDAIESLLRRVGAKRAYHLVNACPSPDRPSPQAMHPSRPRREHPPEIGPVVPQVLLQHGLDLRELG